MVSATCCESVSFQRPLKSVTRPVSTRVTFVSLAHPAIANATHAKAIITEDRSCQPAAERCACAIALSFISIKNIDVDFDVFTVTGAGKAIWPPSYLLPFPGVQMHDRHSCAQSHAPGH